ncbi:MAG: phosphotransferase family protein [Pseudomonadota bacterium]
MEAERSARVAKWLSNTWGAQSVDLSGWRKLSGGAIQENWAVDITVAGGAHDGRYGAVLRTDAPTPVGVSHSRPDEFRLLTAAADAGMTVPQPLALCEARDVIGAPFFVCTRVDGTAEGRKITRDPNLAHFGPALAQQLGAELARLHTIVPPRADLPFLREPPHNVALSRVAWYRAELDRIGASEPALEWGLRWLERNAPEPAGIVLSHMDYRTGNYMVAEGALSAILDWEFAAWGDPREDVSWFCAKCWRFGAIEREAGGIAQRDDFLRGYNGAAARPVAPSEMLYWEVMATVRWAVIALDQGRRFYDHGEPSLELALTATLVPGLSYDVLTYLGEPAGHGANL